MANIIANCEEIAGLNCLSYPRSPVPRYSADDDPRRFIAHEPDLPTLALSLKPSKMPMSCHELSTYCYLQELKPVISGHKIVKPTTDTKAAVKASDEGKITYKRERERKCSQARKVSLEY